ncbi:MULTISPECIES: hypothetical protein [Aeromonas]|uniref:hypothetical protein n=1 Tax=Aeromonas TaxID=642 RepID=UPI00080A9925|nr:MULTISPECIES: hypothetical protein [Aeromonas]ANT70209.1 hypothetical protein TK34_22310 [Aeromonas hydrophila]MDH0348141.1 hypothetical protein [Aeromonas dhakensis]
MTLDELEAAKIELVGDAFGSRTEFAKLLGLKGHHSLRGYHRRNSVPQWIEDRIKMLREIRELRRAREEKAQAANAKRRENRLKKKAAQVNPTTV